MYIYKKFKEKRKEKKPSSIKHPYVENNETNSITKFSPQPNRG